MFRAPRIAGITRPPCPSPSYAPWQNRSTVVDTVGYAKRRGGVELLVIITENKNQKCTFFWQKIPAMHEHVLEKSRAVAAKGEDWKVQFPIP